MNLLEYVPTVIGTAAVAPALLVLWLVVATDERPGPPAKVWTAFVLGGASISLLGLARAPFASILTAPENLWAAQALRSIFAVAAPEEIVKILAIVAVSARRRRFADPMDTVVYGAAAGLGFAAYENLAYLVQHVEMWQSLAALRSVLTVPFHAALGIIAGAYLAIARAGTALGAHRHHRDWARLSSRVLILLAPLALHAAFDFPLLILQQNPDLNPSIRLVLGSASVLIGFSSIAFAVRLVRRVGRHHAPRTDIARERLSQLRRMWALLVVGGGAGFAGLAFVLSSIHHWLVNPDRNMAPLLIPLGLISILIGIALLVATTAIYILGRNRIRTTTPQGFSSTS
jgi:RsiW-degrading membrane proteinase PrsW (M82 family)